MKCYIIALAALNLLACSSSVEEKIEQQKNKTIESKQEKATELLDKTPKWFLSPPKNSDEAYFALAYAQSDNLSNAVDKARLKGEFLLTKQIQSELSAVEQLFSDDDKQSYQLLVETLISEVQLQSYAIQKKSVFSHDGKYQVFLLLEQAKKPKKLPETQMQLFKDLKKKVAKNKAKSNKNPNPKD